MVRTNLGTLAILVLLAPIVPIGGTAVQTHEAAQVPDAVGGVPYPINGTTLALLPSEQVNVFALYSHEPAPMGIADYGVGPSGSYEYATNASLGTVSIVSFSTVNRTGGTQMTIQLNVNLKFTVAGQVRVYWVQNVALLDTSSDLIIFTNNIWNFSASGSSTMAPSAVSGTGTVYKAGKESYYGSVANASLPGNNVALALPAAVQLEVQSGVNSVGQPVVGFYYNDGDGLQQYDSVTFLTSGRVALSGFVVDGAAYNPAGIFYDSELILGGPGGGSSTSDESSDVRMQLYFWNGDNFQEVQNAYNFGSDTAETISNALSQWAYYPADGENIADVQPGSGTLGLLYSSSEIGTIVYNSEVSSGTLEIQNSSDTTATPASYPFTGGKATVTIYPGTYELLLSENGTTSSLGTFSVGAGQTVTVSNIAATVELEMSYSVVDGGSGYTAPILTYTHNGQQVTVPLTTTPAFYAMDVGSTWTVSQSLPGSSSTERWATEQQDSGVVSSSETFAFVYYNQFLETVNYSLLGGGSPPAPVLAYTTFGELGTLQLTNSAQPIWVDSGSSYTVPAQLSGSSTSARWNTATTSGTVTGSSVITFSYYHQYFITTGYAVTGGGSGYGVPTLTCPEFGVQTSVALGAPIWADASASCSYLSPLPGSTQTERWATPSPGPVISAPGTVTATYYHQYSLGVTYTIDGGGSPAPPTLTSTFFGVSSSVSLPSTSSTEWIDVGSDYSLPNTLPSSTGAVRWYTTSATSGALNAPSSISLTYYHQFLVSAFFTIVGGGNPKAPTLQYTTLGAANATGLLTTAESLWVDSATTYSVPAQLGGSNSSDRWVSSVTSGAITSAVALNFTYYHEVLLTVSGVVSSSQWYNASAMATVSLPGISDRSSGTGERVASYSLDGGAPVVIPPTSGKVTITVTMDAPHQLTVTAVEQYEVTMGASVKEALVSITPPTIAGDDYWYDQGAAVSIILLGVWNRTSGSGERLASYTVNGVTTDVSSTNQVDAVSLTSISSPLNVTAAITEEYQLDTNSGSLLSLTPPTVSGDPGWYDAGTLVTATYAYTWNSTAGQSRVSATGYEIGQEPTTQLKREANGTFPVEVAMSAPEAITILSVTQYSFSVSGGSGVSVSSVSPTGDSFYDAGSSLTVSTAYTWGLTGGDIRQNLLSYTLDGSVTNVTRAVSGNFTTPAIAFTGPQQLTFSAVAQYLISFQFRDSSGTQAIVPSSFQVEVNDPQIINVTQFQLWLDNGTTFQVYSVIWEGANVTPNNITTYTATSPANHALDDNVFPASLEVRDYLGTSISGATMTLTLANGTTIQRTTSSNGSVELGLIPLGTFHGSMAYLGTTTKINGNAALSSVTKVRVPLSYQTLELLGVVVVVAIVVIVGSALAVRSRQKREQPKPVGSPPPTQPAVSTMCKYCGGALFPGEPFCPYCGRNQNNPAG